MKKLIILLLLPLWALSQNLTVPLPPGIVYEQRLNAKIDSLAKALTGTVKPPPVPLPACKRGPTIEGISKITSTSANVLFDGDSVIVIAYEIRRENGSRVILDSIRPQWNTITVTYPALSNGSYFMRIAGKSCKSDTSQRKFTVKTDEGTAPPPVPTGSTHLGTYTTTVGNRTYTYNRTPFFTLQFNQDGTITDNTPGLTFGNCNQIDSKNVYYMEGYSLLVNKDGSYNPLRNLYLPDGIYTLRQFVSPVNVAPDLNAFKQKLTGWGDGVNSTNSKLSEIFLSIKTKGATSNSIVPSWIHPSRQMTYTSVAQPKDWKGKFFGMMFRNDGPTIPQLNAIGVNVDMDFGNMNPQPRSFVTVRLGHAHIPSPDELNGLGRHFAERSGFSDRFILTDEIPENTQNMDPDIWGKMYHFYKGASDALKEKGISNPRNTGLYGPYGGDNFTGLFNEFLLPASRETVEKSLTTHVHKGYGVSGLGKDDQTYYASDQVSVRNANLSFYMYNNLYKIPYQIIFSNERLKVGSKTYQGQDREKGAIIFSWHKTQSLVEPFGKGIEYASTGEIIPYANGEITSIENLEIPAPWNEYIQIGFWGTLVMDGVAMWNGGGLFGKDTTKLSWWTDQQVYWTPRGGERQRWVANQNGAPGSSGYGLINRLWSAPGDASYAGFEAAWLIRNRTQKLEHVSYSSSLGDFIAKPGTSGYHLNGFGPLNRNLFTIKDIYDQKKGISLVGTGPEGAILIYYNGFLSVHEYEDNVKIRYNGIEYNLGRVYGRQTIVKPI